MTEMQFCSNCGAKLALKSAFCGGCGSATTTSSSNMVSNEINIKSVSEQSFRLFVGDRYDTYYKKKWETDGSPPKPNILGLNTKRYSRNYTAFLLTFLWMFYRKMYIPAFIGLTIYALFIVAIGRILGESSQWAMIATFAPSIILLHNANALYLSDTRRKISHINSSGFSSDIMRAKLEEKGGVNLTVTVIIGATLLVMVLLAKIYG